MNPLQRFSLLGYWGKWESVCLEHKPCAGLSWCLAGHTRSFLCQKGDEHFTALSAWVPMRFMDWNTQKLSHKSHAASLGVEEEQKGRGCWRRGAKPHLRLSAGGDETMYSYLTPFQRHKWFCKSQSDRHLLQWGVPTKITEWLSDSSFPSCKLKEIFPKDVVKIIRVKLMLWCEGPREPFRERAFYLTAALKM